MAFYIFDSKRIGIFFSRVLEYVLKDDYTKTLTHIEYQKYKK